MVTGKVILSILAIYWALTANSDNGKPFLTNPLINGRLKALNSNGDEVNYRIANLFILGGSVAVVLRDNVATAVVVVIAINTLLVRILSWRVWRVRVKLRIKARGTFDRREREPRLKGVINR